MIQQLDGYEHHNRNPNGGDDRDLSEFPRSPGGHVRQATNAGSLDLESTGKPIEGIPDVGEVRVARKHLGDATAIDANSSDRGGPLLSVDGRARISKGRTRIPGGRSALHVSRPDVDAVDCIPEVGIRGGNGATPLACGDAIHAGCVANLRDRTRALVLASAYASVAVASAAILVVTA